MNNQLIHISNEMLHPIPNRPALRCESPGRANALVHLFHDVELRRWTSVETTEVMVRFTSQSDEDSNGDDVSMQIEEDATNMDGAADVERPMWGV